MGWGYCGVDKAGRPIGYVHQATCDHPGCDEVIDRGLGYACGGMHGEDEISCDGYFCEKHRAEMVMTEDEQLHRVCESCHQQLLDSGEWRDDDGCLCRVENS